MGLFPFSLPYARSNLNSTQPLTNLARKKWNDDKSQLGVIEQALETAGLMLGTDESRGYCLEMICADFLAGANLDAGNPDALVFSLRRIYKLLPQEQQREFLEEIQKTPCPG